MNQKLLKLIDNWQASYDAWDRGLKHIREWAENGREKNRCGNY